MTNTRLLVFSQPTRLAHSPHKITKAILLASLVVLLSYENFGSAGPTRTYDPSVHGPTAAFDALQAFEMVVVPYQFQYCKLSCVGKVFE